MRETLDEIGRETATDKCSIDHDYLGFYEKHLRHLRDEKFLLVEIGVYKTNSLVAWARYFSKATIVGLDIDPGAASYPLPPNAHVRIGDASKLEFINQIVAEFGVPLVVVDDGSHYWHHQIETLRYFFPIIGSGGIFIMEDIHTSFPAYLEQYGLLSNSSINCYEYLLKINRWVVGSRFMGDERPDDGFISNYYSTIEAMLWYRGSCIIQKKAPASVGGGHVGPLQTPGLIPAKPRAPKFHLRKPLKVGIGIVTYNRAKLLVNSVEQVISRTKHPFDLFVADDGSSDETEKSMDRFGSSVNYLRCNNRGVNYNKNRLLYLMNNVAHYDVMLIIEDDAYPTVDQWEEKWIEGVVKWGHVNNAGWWFEEKYESGNGTIDDPILCREVSAQCVGFSHEAIENVGFIDTRFGNHGCGHGEHSYRMVRAGYGGEFAVENGMGVPHYYLIKGDIDIIVAETGYKPGDIEGLKKYYEYRDQDIYRPAWNNEGDREQLWNEVSEIKLAPSRQSSPLRS